VTVITSHRCVGCDSFQADSRLEPVSVGDDTFRACEACCESLAGPGEHEAIDEDAYPLAVVLEYLRDVSGEDHFLADEWNGYVGVFGEHVLLEDGQGFVEVRSFSTHEAALREVDGGNPP
jgi:hypothetical protein